MAALVVQMRRQSCEMKGRLGLQQCRSLMAAGSRIARSPTGLASRRGFTWSSRLPDSRTTFRQVRDREAGWRQAPFAASGRPVRSPTRGLCAGDGVSSSMWQPAVATWLRIACRHLVRHAAIDTADYSPPDDCSALVWIHTSRGFPSTWGARAPERARAETACGHVCERRNTFREFARVSRRPGPAWGLRSTRRACTCSGRWQWRRRLCGYCGQRKSCCTRVGSD